jgi:SAM-dependent methyltransferase
MNKPETSYDDYVNDEAFLRQYNAYQEKYAVNLRESDKVLIRMIGDAFSRHDAATGRFKLLDIGCSTGNLLSHLRNLFPEMELVGGELAESSLDVCRANPKLNGIRFERLDMLELAYEAEFDAIVANAVAVYFYWDEYAKAARSCNRALKKGGTYLAFEWLHPFAHQDVTIVETSIGHPSGLRICFRPMPKVASVFKDAGFSDIAFHPFELPIELPKPDFNEEVVSYTVKAADNLNLCFRGTLFQPWCHLSATKAN